MARELVCCQERTGKGLEVNAQLESCCQTVVQWTRLLVSAGLGIDHSALMRIDLQ